MRLATRVSLARRRRSAPSDLFDSAPILVPFGETFALDRCLVPRVTLGQGESAPLLLSSESGRRTEMPRAGVEGHRHSGRRARIEKILFRLNGRLGGGNQCDSGPALGGDVRARLERSPLTSGVGAGENGNALMASPTTHADDAIGPQGAGAARRRGCGQRRRPDIPPHVGLSP